MTDPWNLLKRAREELGTIEALTLHPKFHNGEGGDELTNFLAEIDSAIKHHEENIGWIRQGSWGRYQGEYGEAFINPAPKATVGYTFFWRVFRKSPKGHQHDGYAKSYEEAQRLATQVLRENQDG